DGLSFARDTRGALVSKTPDGSNYYFYLFDGEGSVVAVTDPSGNVANSYAYDPYGNVVSSSTTVGNPFEYVSGWTSGVTTFTHFGARWYASDPNFTRWTQQDPVAGSVFQPTSQCRYAYASDDPVNLVDPGGAISSACGFAIAGTAVDVLGAALSVTAFGGLTIPVSLGIAAFGLAASLVANRSPLNFAIGFAGLGGTIVAAAFGFNVFGLALDVVGLVNACA
ncbi:MAG TPA: RHS repeat-associated core domain-containing protein, partial [Ktedonobacterales bacterium]|nr:RHS repeat-associated core domain-containing protein [Ktedonobacterales bacterium]